MSIQPLQQTGGAFFILRLRICVARPRASRRLLSFVFASLSCEGAMWKRLLFLAGLICVFAVGVGLGLLLPRGAAETASGAKPGKVAANETAPHLEDWRYPGAVSRGHEGTAGFVENGRLLVPPTHLQLWATPDDCDKVTAFYATKCGFEHTGGGDGSGSKADGGDVWAYLGVNNKESGPLREQYLRRRCGSYDLTVVITRVREEGRTRITLVYEPKVADSRPPQ